MSKGAQYKLLTMTKPLWKVAMKALPSLPEIGPILPKLGSISVRAMFASN